MLLCSMHNTVIYSLLRIKLCCSQLRKLVIINNNILLEKEIHQQKKYRKLKCENFKSTRNSGSCRLCTLSLRCTILLNCGWYLLYSTDLKTKIKERNRSLFRINIWLRDYVVVTNFTFLGLINLLFEHFINCNNSYCSSVWG